MDNRTMNRSFLKEDIQNRLNRFQGLLRERDMDGALLLQKVDLYYFTGSDQDAHLWIPSSGQPVLMVRRSMERSLEDAAIEKIVPLNSLSQIPSYITQDHGGRHLMIGLEMDILPVRFFKIYRQLLPHADMVDASPLIRAVRMIKSPYEISCIKKAADMADRLYERIPDFIRESETEDDLAIRVEHFYRTEGHPGFVRLRTFNRELRYGHILSGVSGSIPSSSTGPTGGQGLGPFASQGHSHKRLHPHEPILVDYASVVDGYISDHTRIFSTGDLDDKFIRAHDLMRKVQDAVAREGRSGSLVKDLYTMAIKMVEDNGLSAGFMGYPQPVPFIGHGIGLEMDEWPVVGKGSPHVLQEGMVVALEPKYIFPGEGAVGIENTFVISHSGMEKLTRFPDDIVIIHE